MSKKSRRARKNTPRNVSRTVAPKSPGEVAEPVVDRPEYSYVVADIRQVAVLAAAMFVLLVGLSFFIG
jgi:hypothetical protein